MAILFVDNLSLKHNRALQIAVKALELILLSAGLISTFVMVKGSLIFPYSCDFVFTSLIGFWNSIKCFFSSSLYICIIINSMVVLIALSSAFHRCENQEEDVDHTEVDIHDHDLSMVKSPPPPAPRVPSSRDIVEVVPSPPSPPIRDITEVVVVSPDIEATNISPLFYNEIKKTTTTYLVPKGKEMSIGMDIEATSKGKEMSTSIDIEATSFYDTEEKEYEEEDDTMEATWNAINGGGKEKPKKKILKKCETWTVPRQLPRAPVQRLDSEELMPSTPKWKELKKSETFDGAVSISCRGGLRRDPTVSLDDFNKQVDAFIKKFNDNMRLQRQESDQRFLDMINQGL